jgi:hypothetical protein
LKWDTATRGGGTSQPGTVVEDNNTGLVTVNSICFPQQMEHVMRKVLLVMSSLVFSTVTMAEAVSCQVAAAAQKLVGPAKTAFLKKCEAESKSKMTLVTNDKRMSVGPTGEFGHCGHDGKDL